MEKTKINQFFETTRSFFPMANEFIQGRMIADAHIEALEISRAITANELCLKWYCSNEVIACEYEAHSLELVARDCK